MLDLSASARRLYHRLLGRRAEAGPADLGTLTEADGAGAVAAIEASISDPAIAGRDGRGRLAATLGLAAAGRRAAAFLSGPELAASVDLLAQAAQRRLPFVVHLTAGDAVGSGHEAYHAAADSGAVALFATDVQEAVDLTLVARRLAEDALVPVVVAMDGAETALSVQDLRLPSPEAVRRFLGGPEELVHSPTPGQEKLFGRHRRRLPRWHDPERALLHGAALGPETLALAAAARRAYFDAHLTELYEQASEAYMHEIGRRPEVLRTYHVEGARFLLIAQGSAVETAEATAVALRAAGVRVGVVGLRSLRPWPSAALEELLEECSGAVVLERAEVPRLASRLSVGLPRLTTALYGLGGFPLRGGDLFALVRQLADREDDWSPLVYLGFDMDSAGGRYPKRQALFDALRRDEPAVADLGVRGGDGLDLLPADALTLSVHHLGADGFTHEAATLLHRLLGGSLRTRPARGWERWGSPRVDVVIQAASPVKDPGDGVPTDVALVLEGDGSTLGRLKDDGVVVLAGGLRPDGLRRGLTAYGASGQSEDHLLGALLGALQLEGRIDTSLRKLLKARRELLEEHGTEDVETCLDELQSGFEKVSKLEESDKSDKSDKSDLRPALRRLGKSSSPLADLPGFWDRVGVLYRDGASSELLPDPFLATAAVPPVSSALRDLSPARTVLPAFDPALCTGCGACWATCPDSAVAPLVIGPQALLDHGMKAASARGRSVDKLRMVVSKVAARVRKDMAAPGWEGSTAGPLCDAAFAAAVGKMKLPEERKAGLREAYEAVREETAELPVARTAPFFDQGDRELFSLAIDPEACKGCGLCVAECGPDALTAADDDPRRTADARALWRLGAELPAPAEATVQSACEHPDVGPLAGALMTPEAREVMAGGHGAEPGSGEALALRQVLGVAAFQLRGVFQRQLAETQELAEKLSAAIHDGLAQALPDRDLDALAEGLDALERPDADLAALTARVETAFEQERVDVDRTRRLVEAARALADLRWRLETGEGGQGRTPFGLVLAVPELAWAAAFPHNPFKVPVTVDATGEAVEVARGLTAGRQRETVEAVRVLRRARLELGRPGDEPDELAWSDLTEDERRWCPPVFLVTTEEALVRSRQAAMEIPQPIKIVVLSDPATEDAPALPHLLRTKAFFVQSSVAGSDSLAQTVAAALDHDGPALVRLLTAEPEVPAGPTDLARPTGQAGSTGKSSPAAAPAGTSGPAEADRIAALDQRHAAELAALRQDYEARLASQRAGFQADMAQRIRSRLMQLAAKAPGDDEARESPS